jgi:hypothetical protein
MNWSLVPLTTPQDHIPTLVRAAGERASMRFLEFFAANIRNAHTLREHAARLNGPRAGTQKGFRQESVRPSQPGSGVRLPAAPFA